MTSEDRARIWRELAKMFRAAAEMCEGSAHVERLAPQASDTFREVLVGLRQILKHVTELLVRLGDT